MEIIKSKKYLNLGPGGTWKKPGINWIRVDADMRNADICTDLNKYPLLPFLDNTISGIYASHFFEHISIFSINRLLIECFRVLKYRGVLRIVIPDVIKSIKHFLDSNSSYSLFKKRKERNPDYTLFECLKEDFISQSLQKEVFGNQSLAHQNAFDFETMETYLKKAGFKNIYKSNYGSSSFAEFLWETGQTNGEWAQSERSLYIESIK